MASASDECQCKYPWEGETEETMKEKHKHDRHLLFERDGMNVERAVLR
jgi:hypothetical protein